MLLATPLPTAHCFAQLLCSSWGLQCQFPALGTSSHPSQTKPGPWCGCTVPHLHFPQEKPSGFLWQSRAWWALCYTARGWPYQAVKFHWNQGDFLCREESMQKSCQDCNLTYCPWVEERKWKSFQWVCLLCNIKPCNERTFTSL